jgi:excisionase family DNA binding protein
MNELNIARTLTEHIRAVVREEIQEFLRQQTEVLPVLPDVATVGELAHTLRVSEKTVRQMAKDGMPHVHAGRELRFWKSMIVEWQQTGKLYDCGQCGAKKNARPAEPPSNGKAPDARPVDKFADFARRNLQDKL